jgi:pyruvate formate lyase activating enzyme
MCSWAVMDIEALINNIQRFSLHDGPGIRTTVFFKGCGLRCMWCHNPEGLSPLPQTDAEGHLIGQRMTVADVMKEVERDIIFYQNSKGGVTVSGGEPLLQKDFVSELLKRCKEQGLHTAVETAGFVKWDAYESVLPYTDLFLHDLKVIDRDKHKKVTGQDNRLILENVERLSSLDTRVWIRIPFIPGVNDSSEDLLAFAEVISHLKHLEKVELMPYHSLGKDKYKRLGMVYPGEHIQEPSAEEVAKAYQVFIAKGLPVKEGA